MEVIIDEFTNMAERDLFQLMIRFIRKAAVPEHDLDSQPWRGSVVWPYRLHHRAIAEPYDFPYNRFCLP
jgi:hypothetical protein